MARAFALLWTAAPQPFDLSIPVDTGVVGEISVANRSVRVGFSLEASDPLLLVEGCRGCGSGCPARVPTCGSTAAACWAAADLVPTQELTWGHCGARAAGRLAGLDVCTECEGGAAASNASDLRTGYSIFYAHAAAPANLHGYMMLDFTFRALLRTSPAVNQLWSAIGLGFRSSFLRQVNASRVLLHLGVESRHIILNPDPARYPRALSTSFSVVQGRRHRVPWLRLGEVTVDVDELFLLDARIPGISLSDASLFSKVQLALAKGARGLEISFGSISVSIDCSLDGSLFTLGERNALGMIFLSAFDVVFDDDRELLFISGAAPAPAPPPMYGSAPRFEL